MKRFLPLIALGLLATSNAQAQAPTSYKHSVGVGFERVGLDGPDDIGNRYLVRYARHLRNDRVAVMVNLGYMSVLNSVNLPGTNYYVEGKRRQRVTTDVTAAFDFIKHPRHAFRVGAGPSLWYREDEGFGGGKYTVNLLTGEVTNVQVKWQPVVKEINFGYNVLVEYEYALTDQLLVSGKLKFFDSRKAGQSTIYGVGLGYRLP